MVISQATGADPIAVVEVTFVSSQELTSPGLGAASTLSNLGVAFGTELVHATRGPAFASAT